METGSKILAGRIALVTGASRGIGRYISQRLAAAGATVVAVARSMDRSVARERYTPEQVMPGTLMETVALIETAGGKAIALGCDLLEAAERDTLIERASAAAGPVDILINNAGFCVFAPIEEMSPAVFDQTFDQYVRVPFALSKAAIPSMKARGAGWIVNISSANALAPRRPFTNKMRSGGSTAYSAAKAALNRLTQGLAEEVVGYNIAVNAVAPSTAILSPGAVELTPEGYATEDPAYMAATVLAMCHRPAVERTGLIAYSMHYPHDEKIPVMSLDGTTRLPDRPAPSHSHPRIEPAGSDRAFG
jgi:NAD(P)-dependent dehydrogenase (short-subunit alcohol dehydrogenase family)